MATPTADDDFSRKLGKQSIASLALGMLLIMLSILLAVTIHFRHFYEVLLLGQLIALCRLPGSRLSGQVYTLLYLVFIGSGVMADLVMGRLIAGFWHYSHFDLLDYIILYAFTYPAAGIVMVQSFLAVKVLLKDRPGWNRPLSARQYVTVIAPLAAALAVSFVEGLVGHNQNLIAVSYVLAVLIASLAMSLVAALNNHRTLIDDLRARPLKMLTALLAATYFNAFLHEIPNVFAHEWIYTNFPLPTVRIFDVPVIALVGWPLLLVFPVSVYYWVKCLPHRPDSADGG